MWGKARSKNEYPRGLTKEPMKIFHNKFRVSLGLACAILIGVALVRLYEGLPRVEAEGPGMVQTLAPVPHDFDWITYVQNYADLRQAGIDTEKKARHHWEEYGKKEGRDYHPLLPSTSGALILAPDSIPAPAKSSAVITPDMAARLQAVSVPPLVRVKSRVFVDSPQVDAAAIRSQYDKIMQRAGIQTKDEAMDLSLTLWEKRRKAYFS